MATGGEEIELTAMDDLPEDIDYDLEYLVRSRHGISGERSFNEATFEKGFHPMESAIKKTWYKSFIPPEPIRTSCLPPTTKRAWKSFLFTRLPILSWIWSYQTSYLVGDVVSGITVAIMHIPQGLAYGLLAGLPAVYGLYASFVPVIVYSIFGTSKHLSVGTFAVISLMVSNAITDVLSSDPALSSCIGDNSILLTGDNATTNHSTNVSGMKDEMCTLKKVEIATTLAFASGLIMVIMGVLQLGFITIFLSEPLISGYTTGAAVHVFTSQLTYIFGIEKGECRGIFSVPCKWIHAIQLIFRWKTEVNTVAFVTSSITIIALIVFRIIDRKLLRKLKVPFFSYSRRGGFSKNKIKWPIPLPSQLIVVMVATVVSYAADFDTRFSVDIINHIPRGVPPLTLPTLSYFPAVLVQAFIIAIVNFASAVSLAQVFATQFGYTIAPSQEFIAYGAMNIFGSFFSSYTAAGSLSRSTVQAVSGGKTQLVGIISSIIIFIVIVALGFLFEPLPKAVLASIIWVALYGMFSQVLDIWRYFKLSVPDMFIWLVVFVSTVLLGVDYGLGVGIGFSLLVVILRVILPRSNSLGRAKNTEIYRDIENYEEINSIPGVVIYRFQAPLCFINCKVFMTRLYLACGIDRTALNTTEPGCLQILCRKIFRRPNRLMVSVYDGNLATSDFEEGRFNRYISFMCAQDTFPDNWNGNPMFHSGCVFNGLGQHMTHQPLKYLIIYRSPSFQNAIRNDVIDNIVPHNPKPGSVHTLILDCAPISFMDSAGVKTMQQIVLDFDKLGMQVIFAGMTKHNRDMLERVGFFELCGKEWLFPSIQDAVNHALIGSKLRPGDREEQLHRTTNIDAETGHTPDIATIEDESCADNNFISNSNHN